MLPEHLNKVVVFISIFSFFHIKRSTAFEPSAIRCRRWAYLKRWNEIQIKQKFHHLITYNYINIFKYMFIFMQKKYIKEFVVVGVAWQEGWQAVGLAGKESYERKVEKKTLSLFYASEMKSSEGCVVTERWGKIWITLISLMKRRWKGRRNGGEPENLVSKEVLSIYPLEDGLSYFIPFCSMLFCRQCWISSSTWTQIWNDKCEQLQHLNIEIVFSASVWYCCFCRLLLCPRDPPTLGRFQ